VALGLALTSLACGLEGLDVSDVGEAPTCQDLATWPSASVVDELEILALIDDVRTRGTMCGEEAVPGVEQLDVSGALRCTARRHAADLSRHPELGLSHEGSDGSTPLSRANISGYGGITRHEVLAADHLSAQSVFDAWMADPGTCALLMDTSIDEIAAGHARSPTRDRLVWVVLTGQLRE
jgi:uncharacterized protein YkwD